MYSINLFLDYCILFVGLQSLIIFLVFIWTDSKNNTHLHFTLDIDHNSGKLFSIFVRIRQFFEKFAPLSFFYTCWNSKNPVFVSSSPICSFLLYLNFIFLDLKVGVGFCYLNRCSLFHWICSKLVATRWRKSIQIIALDCSVA